jgi:serine/threonine protein kinase
MKEETYPSFSRKIDFDFFDLGVTILRCVFGDFLSCFFEYENTRSMNGFFQDAYGPYKSTELSEKVLFLETRQSDSLGSFLKRLSNRPLKCCLLHELIHFSLGADTKEKEKTEKFKELFNHIITTKYSRNFQSFLCHLLSFNSASRVTSDALLSHSFLTTLSVPLVSSKRKGSGSDEDQKRQKMANLFGISLEETIRLHSDVIGSSAQKEDARGSLVYFERVLLGLSVALEDCEPLVSFDDSELANFKAKPLKGLIISRSSQEIRRLSEEFGVSEDLVFSKLRDLYC